MKPVEFAEQNTVLAKDQPQYQPLPVHLQLRLPGMATSCWQLTWRERLQVLFTGRLWLQQMTFGTPLQPQLPSVDKPSIDTGAA
jgi:hypothetical protein